jgi:hypothetical protein
MSSRLYKTCIYTCIYAIAKADKLDWICNENDGKGELEEDRRWVTAEEHLREAQKHNFKLPMLFTDAAHDTSQLIYWAVLEDIKLIGDKTRYSFSGLRPLLWGEHATQDLILESSGKPIAPHFIRSYAICQTPEFLRGELLAIEANDPEEL